MAAEPGLRKKCHKLKGTAGPKRMRLLEEIVKGKKKTTSKMGYMEMEGSGPSSAVKEQHPPPDLPTFFVIKGELPSLTCRHEPAGVGHCKGLSEDIRAWQRSQVTFLNVAVRWIRLPGESIVLWKIRFILCKFRYLPRKIRWMRTET